MSIVSSQIGGAQIVSLGSTNSSYTVGYSTGTMTSFGDTSYLYEVVVVDTDGGIIMFPEYVVAKDIEAAKFKAGVYTTLTEMEVDIEDVTIIVNSKGNVRVKDKKNNCCK